jgi:hypothetical protein
MEAQEAFRHLADRFDRIEVLDTDLAYNPTIVSRSLQQLHVALRQDRS